MRARLALLVLAISSCALAATGAKASDGGLHPDPVRAGFSAADLLAPDDRLREPWDLPRLDVPRASFSRSDTRLAWSAGPAAGRAPDTRLGGLTDLARSAAWLALADPGGGSSSGGNGGPGQVDMKEMSQQSANPVSKFAYVFTQFATVLSDGDARGGGDTKASGQITFQPIIPIPVYGEDENEWRIVTRPTITFFAQQSVPQPAEWNRKTGLSDTLIPLPLALPQRIAGRWLLALGPDFSLPTATHDAFGVQQWTAGVSGVVGYIGDNWMAGAYPQMYWRIADQGRNDDVRKARFGNMFYWFWYNLRPDLQIGWSPTIQFNDQARSDDKWNVPVGLGLAKMVYVGKWLTRIEVAAEYSVVHEETFGERARFKINIIPVVGRPIKRALFGRGN